MRDCAYHMETLNGIINSNSKVYNSFLRYINAFYLKSCYGLYLYVLNPSLGTRVPKEALGQNLQESKFQLLSSKRVVNHDENNHKIIKDMSRN